MKKGDFVRWVPGKYIHSVGKVRIVWNESSGPGAEVTRVVVMIPGSKFDEEYFFKINELTVISKEEFLTQKVLES